MPKAILVTGGREYDNAETIERVLRAFPPGTVVIQGMAPGADMMAKIIAEVQGKPGISVPYFKWLGKAGGPARNTLMLKILLGLKTQGYDIEVIAFHEDLSKSKGTKNMLAQVKKADIPWTHYQ